MQDLLLPRTLVNRIARGVLPANTSIQRDAILALTKSATVFISHLAAEANEMTDRKTIQSADVLKALQEIEFAQVMNIGVTGKDGKRGGRIEREIELWENNVRGKRRGYRDKVKARDSTGGGGGGAYTTVDSIAIEEEEGDEHQSKRRKRDSEEVMIEEGESHNASALSGTRDSVANDTSSTALKPGRLGLADDMADEDESEDMGDSEDEEDDEQLEEEERDEEEELREAEDSVDADESSRRKHETLAPDGRIEVVDSSDEESE